MMRINSSNQHYSPHQNTMLSLLALALLLSCTLQQDCQPIFFDQYSFDISSLSSMTLLATVSNGIVSLTPCSLKCNAFVSVGDTPCQAYTLSQTVPSVYSYIDPNNPQTGLSISYLPLVNATISYSSTLNIYCSQLTQTPPTCLLKTTPNVSSVLTCSMNHSTGCPKVVVNDFWQFLIDNRIWFSIALWVFALIELLLGYAVIRATIFLFGVMTGSIFGIIYTAQNYVDFAYQGLYGIQVSIVLISVLMGILFGVTILTIPKLGYVNIGIWVAVIFALLLQNGVLYLTGGLLAFYLTLGVGGLVMAVVSLLALRNFIVVSTAFISAFWLVRPLGFYLPFYPNQFQAEKLIALGTKTPWQFYLYLVSIIVVGILGTAFQFCLTKKKGRDQANKGYYLEEEGSLREKMQKLLEFKEIKEILQSGKEEFMFLKNIVVEDSQQDANSAKKGAVAEKSQPRVQTDHGQADEEDDGPKNAKRNDENTNKSKKKKTIEPKFIEMKKITKPKQQPVQQPTDEFDFEPEQKQPSKVSPILQPASKSGKRIAIPVKVEEEELEELEELPKPNAKKQEKPKQSAFIANGNKSKTSVPANIQKKPAHPLIRAVQSQEEEEDDEPVSRVAAPASKRK